MPMATEIMSMQRFSLIFTLGLVIMKGVAGCQFGTGCVYACHCLGGAVCDAVTGECPGAACDDGSPGDTGGQNGKFFSGTWHGPACQTGNVAYMKPLDALLNHKRSATVLSNYAVDGKYETRQSGGSKYSRGYFASWERDEIDQPVWLSVDLQALHLVFSVTLFDHEANSIWLHLYDTYVRVGNVTDVRQQAVCSYIDFNDPGYLLTAEDRHYVKTCDQPLLGRYVSLQRPVMMQIYLVEIRVEGYQYEDCAEGLWGPGCVTACGSYCLSACDVIKGTCTQCGPGWTGPTCSQQYSHVLTTDLTRDAGLSWTTTACFLTWGADCQFACNCKDGTEACHAQTGACPASGCAENYVGTGCDLALPRSAGFIWLKSRTETTALIQFILDPTVSADQHAVTCTVQYERLDSGVWETGNSQPCGVYGKLLTIVQTGLDPYETYNIRIQPAKNDSVYVYQGRPSPSLLLLAWTQNNTQPPPTTPQVTIWTSDTLPTPRPTQKTQSSHARLYPFAVGASVGMVLSALFVSLFSCLYLKMLQARDTPTSPPH